MIILGISSLGIGGAQVWVKSLADLLSERFDIELVYGGLYGGISHAEATSLVAGLHLNRIRGLHRPFNPFAILSAYRYFRTRRDALIIVSSFGAGVNLRIAAMAAGNPVWYVSHGWSFRYQRFPGSWLAKQVEAFLGRFSTVICVSKADFDHARDLLHIPPKNLALVRNRLVRNDCASSPRAARGGESVKKVLYVGRNAEPKRFDLYIELSKLFRDVEFHAVGPLLDDFVSVPETIILHGRIADFDRYDEYDIFCLFSDSEGLPMSALEAHTLGVPLLLSNVGGCPELVRGNGMLVENRIDDIATKFATMVTDIESFRAAAMAERSRFSASKQAIVRLVERAHRVPR